MYWFRSICTLLIVGLVSAQKDPHQWANRNTIVHLFEWKWADIAKECEEFLQHKGYGGVQVSPPNENIIVATATKHRPWWERYQPISYNLITRSGNEAAFADMVTRCNNVGIRIYVDTVINHMSADSSNPIGVGGSTAAPGDKNFPAVPYSYLDFHGTCSIGQDDYWSAEIVRNCELEGLKDLDHGSSYVRGKVLDYLNHLVELGVAGFRVDACKHMWPGDLEPIYNGLNNLNTTHGFPTGARPFIYQEVINLSDDEAILVSEYTHMGQVTEFKYSAEIGWVFRGGEKLAELWNWGAGWGMMPDGRDAFVFVDNHDNQRGHGAGGPYILTYKTPRKYKMAIAFMLAHPYGTTRIMSSFAFEDRDEGPPANGDDEIISPEIVGDICVNGWVCEHRWRQIYNMIGFKEAVKGTGLNDWWSNGDQQIAFCRGDKGFIAFTNGGDINALFQTCLPPGDYCDVISGSLENGVCTGRIIHVEMDGWGHIILNDEFEDGVLAIHANAKQVLKSKL